MGFFLALMQTQKYIIIFQNLNIAFKKLLSYLKCYVQTFKKTEAEEDKSCKRHWGKNADHMIIKVKYYRVLFPVESRK